MDKKKLSCLLRSTNSLIELPTVVKEDNPIQNIFFKLSSESHFSLDSKVKTTYSSQVFLNANSSKMSTTTTPSVRSTFLARQSSFDEGGETRLSSAQVKQRLKTCLLNRRRGRMSMTSTSSKSQYCTSSSNPPYAQSLAGGKSCFTSLDSATSGNSPSECHLTKTWLTSQWHSVDSAAANNKEFEGDNNTFSHAASVKRSTIRQHHSFDLSKGSPKYFQSDRAKHLLPVNSTQIGAQAPLTASSAVSPMIYEQFRQYLMEMLSNDKSQIQQFFSSPTTGGTQLDVGTSFSAEQMNTMLVMAKMMNQLRKPTVYGVEMVTDQRLADTSQYLPTFAPDKPEVDYNNQAYQDTFGLNIMPPKSGLSNISSRSGASAFSLPTASDHSVMEWESSDYSTTQCRTPMTATADSKFFLPNDDEMHFLASGHDIPHAFMSALDIWSRLPVVENWDRFSNTQQEPDRPVDTKDLTTDINSVYARNERYSKTCLDADEGSWVTAVAFDTDMLEHKCLCSLIPNRAVHPESPERLLQALDDLVRRPMRIPTQMPLSAAYWARLLRVDCQSRMQLFRLVEHNPDALRSLIASMPLLVFCRPLRARMATETELELFHSSCYVRSFASLDLLADSIFNSLSTSKSTAFSYLRNPSPFDPRTFNRTASALDLNYLAAIKKCSQSLDTFTDSPSAFSDVGCKTPTIKPLSSLEADDCSDQRLHHHSHQSFDSQCSTSFSNSTRLCALGCGGLGVDSDTVWNPYNTMRASRLAVGQVMCLAHKVAQRELRNGFAIVRPPGHHAESDEAMGFCYFNSVAIAALHLLERKLVQRVLILDWDIHHGNGTKFVTNSHPGIVYVSMHRHDGGTFFPGTGSATAFSNNGNERAMSKRESVDVYNYQQQHQSVFSTYNPMDTSLAENQDGDASCPTRSQTINIAWERPSSHSKLKLFYDLKQIYSDMTKEVQQPNNINSNLGVDAEERRKRWRQTLGCNDSATSISSHTNASRDQDDCLSQQDGRGFHTSTFSVSQSFRTDSGIDNMNNMGDDLGDADSVGTGTIPSPLLGLSDAEYLAAMRSVVLPIAHEFQPDIILISAGFDAGKGHDEALGGYSVSAGFFAWATHQCMSICNSRVVLVLEGGYCPSTVSDCIHACVNTLLLPAPQTIWVPNLIANPYHYTQLPGLSLGCAEAWMRATDWISLEELNRPPHLEAVVNLLTTIRHHAKLGWKCLANISEVNVARSFAEAMKYEQMQAETDSSGRSRTDIITSLQHLNYVMNSPLTDHMARLHMDQI